MDNPTKIEQFNNALLPTRIEKQTFWYASAVSDVSGNTLSCWTEDEVHGLIHANVFWVSIKNWLQTLCVCAFHWWSIKIRNQGFLIHDLHSGRKKLWNSYVRRLVRNSSNLECSLKKTVETIHWRATFKETIFWFRRSTLISAEKTRLRVLIAIFLNSSWQ